MVTLSPHEDIARDCIALWNDRAYDRIPEVIAEDFVMYDPFAPEDEVPGPKGEVHGPDGLATFIRGVVRGFPDFHVDVHELLGGSGTAMYDGTLSMTHEGPFFGIPPTGQHADVRYMGWIRVEGDRVIEHRVYPPVMQLFDELQLPWPEFVAYIPRLLWSRFLRLW